MNSTIALRRSVLFVPGADQKRIEKSASIPADVLVFDLEDAVSPADKVHARKMVVEVLQSVDIQSRQCVVRVNSVASEWFAEDMHVLAAINHRAIMLPKCESKADLVKLHKLNTNKPMFALVETAKGVLNIAELAAQLNDGDLLCFGHLDFATDMGLSSTDMSKGAIYHARCQLAIAAHAYGVVAIDASSLEVRNEKTIKQETLEGLNLGYQGKLCIHPKQVDIVNEVYTPTEQQVDKAKALLAEWDESLKQGASVFTFENKMVDLPVIRAQQNMLARYDAIMATQT